MTVVPVDSETANNPTLQQTFTDRSTNAKAEAEARALEQSWRKEIGSRYAEAEDLLKQLEP